MRKSSTKAQIINSDLSHRGKLKRSRRDRVLMRLIELDMDKTMRDLCGKSPLDKWKGAV